MAERKEKAMTPSEVEAIIQKAVFQAMEQYAGGNPATRDPNPQEQHLARILAQGDAVYARMQAALEAAVRDEMKRLESDLMGKANTAYGAIPNEVAKQFRESGFWPKLDKLTDEQAKLTSLLQEVEKKQNKSRGGKSEVRLEDLTDLGYRIKEVERKIDILNQQRPSAQPGSGVVVVAADAPSTADDRHRTGHVSAPGQGPRGDRQPEAIRVLLWTCAFLACFWILAFGAVRISNWMPKLPTGAEERRPGPTTAKPDMDPPKTVATCPSPGQPPELAHEAAWVQHFENVKAPDVVRAAFGIDEMTFKDELIRLAKVLENNRKILLEAPVSNPFLKVHYNQNFRFGTSGDIQVRVAYTKDEEGIFYDWIKEAYKGDSPAKPNAKNVCNLWLHLASDSSDQQRDLNKPHRAKTEFLEKLESRLQLNKASALADLLAGSSVDPLAEQTIGHLKSVFKNMDVEKYRTQMHNLAEALMTRRQDQDFIDLSDVIAEQNSRLYAVMCRDGQPTPLETWYRAGKAAGGTIAPDQSILVLWLSAKLGTWQCDGTPDEMIAMLRKLAANASDPFATLKWSN